jgi:formamidopyrimidine-DNA glycosylase
MPELPDLVLYLEALQARLVGQRLERIRLLSPFVLRSVEPPIDAVTSQIVSNVTRVGKRIVVVFNASTPSEAVQGRGPSTAVESPGDDLREDDLFLVLHLMIAGRLRWREPGRKPRARPGNILASLEFEHGTLFFTEASSKKRASMQLVRGKAPLRALDPGGVEPLEATADEFRAALTRGNHTVKRALTDPRLVSGIGNAYSDEILHAARLSPLKLTGSLSVSEIDRLYRATRDTLSTWIERLRADGRGAFPEKVTAFRDDMAVHGRYRQPCPVCGAPVQRIVYADHECNYCATCQTGGRLLADRSLSRLLKDDWPERLEG